MWFTEFRGNKIGRISPTGVVNEYPLPTLGSNPAVIAAGPDGNMWFTEQIGNKIGKITPAGVITEYALPAYSAPGGIAAGSDGNMWFTEVGGNRIGSITPTGVITEVNIPTAMASAVLIAAGPDGNMWFTERTGNKIGSITPAGVITEYAIPLAKASPSNITAGADGNMWFTAKSKIGFIATGRGASLTATVSGGDTDTSRLTCTYANTTSWSPGAVGYQWRRNGVSITGATDRTYTVQSNDVGSKISCRVSVTFRPTFSQQAVTSVPVLIKE
jgi:virginiamycin B lyase